MNSGLGIVRINDNCSGHECWPPRPSISGSPNVFVNNQRVERYNDELEIHCCTEDKDDCHNGLHIGVRNVKANNRSVQIRFDPIDCGSVCDECSGNVMV